MNNTFRTIGVLMDWIRSPYHAAIVDGIMAAAAGHNLNILFFRTGELHPGFQESSATDYLYKLIKANTLDYLVVLSGVTHKLSYPEKEQFLQLLPCRALLTLCFKVKDFPCILLDNRTGLNALISHIIQTHERKRLVFLGGPRNSQDSNERFEVFRDALAGYNLPLYPELIVPDGAFTVYSGEKAIDILTRERGLIPGRDFDAVISANDAMAIGAVNMLTGMNVRIPQDVSVGGFDAHNIGISLDASLTTVRLPYRELGVKAVQFFLEQPPESKLIMVPTRLVIRQSCGCSRQPVTARGFTPALFFTGIPALFRKDRAALEQQISRVFSRQLEDKESIGKLLDSFASFLENRDGELFLITFRQIISSASRPQESLVVWNYPLNILKHWLQDVFPGNPDVHAIKYALDQGHGIIDAQLNLAAIDYKINLENYILFLRYTDEMIRINLEQKELLLNLTNEMNRLDFGSYHIFLYRHRENGCVEYELLFSCRNRQPLTGTEGKSRFGDFASIITHCLAGDAAFSYFALPVSYADQKYGFILIGMSPRGYARIAYEDIAYQLGSNFRSNAILQTIQETNHKLESANTVLERTQQQLQQEMVVARKIQESLLPVNLRHKELSMDAKMVTAVLVGGDYYDFIPTPAGQDWIVLGDASGHGMNAGLLMMMVQTAIHILLKEEPRIAPHILLARVNDVLLENIRKLGDNKYITIIVLSYHGRGLFTFSGMHLPLFIYRQKTGKVEAVNTNGIWLGVIDHIEDLNRDRTIRLEKGDCLLLYTDGATEAFKHNDSRLMYGEERLAETFARCGHKAPDAIIEDLFADLSSFSIEDDDVTLFAIKYL